MMESIMQDIKECFLCREEMNKNNNFKRLTSDGLECHHIMHGTANRKISEHYGLKVWLCPEHHRTGKEAVHKCRETDLKLIEKGQKRFERLFSHEEWMNLFMKNYL